MQVWQIAASVRLGLMVILAGGLVGGWAVPGQFSRAEASPVPERREPTPTAERPEAVEVSEVVDRTTVPASEQASVSVPSAEVLPLSELERPATTVEEWVAQMEASLVQITNVRVEATESGLQVVLETENGSLAVPETQTLGNALIADIPNATIAEEFSQANPIEGIALVSVTSLPGDRVRVAITGTDAPPVAEVRSEAQGLAFAVTLGEAGTAADEDAIQVVVTGEQDEGYNPSSASTATRTDTLLRDIPQSIQVVPRQVLEDRNVQSLTQAVETVSGVIDAGVFYGAPAGSRLIRGFGGYDQAGNFRNGFRDVDFFGVTSVGTIEQVEVLKGPASVLFGALEPGGIINVITRQPLDEPYYNLGFEVGNYELYQPSIDISGPLTTDDTLLYRFIASYQSAGSYQDFVSTDLLTIAPSVTLNLGDRTRLNLYYEYAGFTGDPPLNNDLPLLSDDSFPPRSLYPGYPDFAFLDIDTHRFGYTLNHQLSDNWQLRNNIAIALVDVIDDRAYPSAVENDRFLTNTVAFDSSYRKDNYFGQIDLLGEFNTGSIAHQLLVGFDANRFVDQNGSVLSSSDFPPLDIRDPNYDIPNPDFELAFAGSDGLVQSYGVYLQDQVAFSDNLKLLIGGRYDWVSYENEIREDGIDQTAQKNGAFSPRIGIVYQPNDIVSLYASYSRSFRQTTGRNLDGEAFEPTRGTQYEVGVRTDFLDGRLSANLAAYHLTKTNITTPDLENTLFSVQTGEARSQGIELDISGEILPGWNIIASYAYTDAVVTEDNVIPEGNRLANVPEHQASLWTTYTIQEGDFRGLGFGLGLFYIGERQGSFDLATPFTIGSDFRTDAAVYYRRGQLNAAINIRNLLDTDNATFSFSRNVVQRDAPLTIIGSVSWTF
jgi:iron complex outermembrane receptor protein